MTKGIYQKFLEEQRSRTDIPYGYCYCGCGQKTNIARVTDSSKSWIRGEPLLFCRYHQFRCYDPGECMIDGCHRQKTARGVCEAHWRRVRYGYHGEPDTPIKTQNRKGEGTITPDGYRIYYRDRKKIHEHREVMEMVLGRPLQGDEIVHHKNGNRLDNRPENLELWHRGHPIGQRIEDKVRWAWEIISRYDPDHQQHFRSG